MPVAYSMSLPQLNRLQIKTEERGPPPSYEEVIGYRVMKVIGMFSALSLSPWLVDSYTDADITTFSFMSWLVGQSFLSELIHNITQAS